MLKTGSCSIIMGKQRFGYFFPPKDNKLLKITKITPSHNEFTYLHIVKSIDNYSKYYSIPDEQNYLLKPSDDFYKHLFKLCQHESMKIFVGNLNCFYIDNAGDKDLFDTIINIESNYDLSFWKSYNRILKFTKQIMLGLKFLHDKKLCHLDIKPENIIVNTKNFTFKIIDFGFCSKEPFSDFIYNMKGTPGYFPKYIKGDIFTTCLPKIIANDCIEIDGSIPMRRNHLLVYKIDSYCLGRTLYFLKYIYDENVMYECCNFETNKGIKLDSIIKDLLEPNCWNRKTINECLVEYFNIA